MGMRPRNFYCKETIKRMQAFKEQGLTWEEVGKKFGISKLVMA